MSAEIKVKITDPKCPKCGKRMDWDAFGDIHDEWVKIDCWCLECKDHRTLKITRR